MLSFLFAIPIIGPWIKSLVTNLTIVLICGALLIVTNGISVTIGYVKGHNSAVAQCKVNTLIRERDELKRDRDVQKETGDFLRKEVNRLSTAQAKREQKDAEDAANFTPIPGCVVPARPVSRVRGKRPVK